MAEIKLTIDLLKGDRIVVGSAPKSAFQAARSGSLPHSETRFTLEDGTVEVVRDSMSKMLGKQWLEDNGYLGEDGWTWKKNVVRLDVGNDIVGIEDGLFASCQTIDEITIPGKGID